ncbi:MAG: hypothetical protein M3Y42_03050 [Actinomycetota bacterium]|nr:hypothetical protein [Actinomycetota bacterium]MDQ2955925.1 hypothetical protein [Actinomycetota bacterium]
MASLATLLGVHERGSLIFKAAMVVSLMAIAASPITVAASALGTLTE